MNTRPLAGWLTHWVFNTPLFTHDSERTLRHSTAEVAEIHQECNSEEDVDCHATAVPCGTFFGTWEKRAVGKEFYKLKEIKKEHAQGSKWFKIQCQENE